MKKQFLYFVSAVVLSMTFMMNPNAVAQQKAEPEADASSVPSRNKLQQPGSLVQQLQPGQKTITRAQFMELDGPSQQDVIMNPDVYVISDLVNATPADLGQRKQNASYIAAPDFKNLSADSKWQVLKNPSLNIVVQEAAQIPKIKITLDEFNNMSQEQKSQVKTSQEYEFID